MRVFLSGLGMNGKTSLLNKYSELSTLSFSSNEIYDKLSGLNNGEKADIITKFRSEKYLNIDPDIQLIDRCIIDQLAMYLVFELGPIRRSNIFQPILNNLTDYFNEDDVIILIDGSDNKDVEDIFTEQLNSGRSGVYKNVEQYKTLSKVFNAAFLGIVESKIPNIEHHIVKLNSFSDLSEVEELINKKFYDQVDKC